MIPSPGPVLYLWRRSDIWYPVFLLPGDLGLSANSRSAPIGYIKVFGFESLVEPDNDFLEDSG